MSQRVITRCSPMRNWRVRSIIKQAFYPLAIIQRRIKPTFLKSRCSALTMKMILERTVQLGPLLALYFMPVINHCAGQTFQLRSYSHNNSHPKVVPNSLKLSPALIVDLALEVPQDFEKVVLQNRYKFTKREYLIKALLHKSYEAKRRRDRLDSFTPLDQIGDMVLNYMITRILIMNSQSNLNTKALSKMRSAILQRNAISFIAIKNKVDDYIFINEQHLANTSSTAKFKEQVKNLENYQALVAAIIDPKRRPTSGSFLPDIVKAIIGAVYVDSGYDIQKTDDVIMPMFKKEIEVVYNKVYNDQNTE
ncbi:uncharacterized protein LOC111243925 isoform X2 [Varroa destructor]|uniref:RNase III domain-containing protein n=1 Tax=Varroa destructor TaxID=109461 RepID=A0A7M7J8H3_VARDE|nr:uncharacterized protein LOC111243925 isoform X2 [Varroa destructor]